MDIIKPAIPNRCSREFKLWDCQVTIYTLLKLRSITAIVAVQTFLSSCGKVKPSTPQDSCFSGLWKQLMARSNLPLHSSPRDLPFSGLPQLTSLHPLISPEVCLIFDSTWVFILKPALQQHSLSWSPKSTLYNPTLARRMRTPTP